MTIRANDLAACVIISIVFAQSGFLVAATSTELSKITPADLTAGDWFGDAVAMDGNLALVGSRFNSTLTGPRYGAAYVYDVSNSNLVSKLTATDRSHDDLFGGTVALHGNTALISAAGDDDKGSRSGSAYLFNVQTGQQLWKLLASDGDSSDQFGISVGLDANYAVIGANLDEQRGQRAGAAYLFDVTTGQQLAKLFSSDISADDDFGGAVAIDNGLAVISSARDDVTGPQSGSAYVFDVAAQTQLTKLVPTDGAASDLFGISVAIDGNYALIGAPYDDDHGQDSGSAYLFNVQTGAQIAKLTGGNGSIGSHFGSSVSLHGDLAVVGANHEVSNVPGVGSAYVFDIRTGQELVKLTPSDGVVEDFFGRVAIANGIAFVGAYGQDQKGQTAGAVYTYDLSAYVVPEPTTFIFVVGFWGWGNFIRLRKN